MTGGMSSRTCYTKLNFDFPYVRSLSLRRDPYIITSMTVYFTSTLWLQDVIIIIDSYLTNEL